MVLRTYFLILLFISAFAVAGDTSPYASPLYFEQEQVSLSPTQRWNFEERLANQMNRKKGFLQAINVGGVWTPGADSSDMGLTEFKLGVAFGLPGPKVPPLSNSFFMLTPNFSYTNVRWNDAEFFPNDLYTAGLSVLWMKPLNNRWSLLCNTLPTYAGDGKATSETVRCPAIFGAVWTPSQKWKVVFGAVYLDRSDIPALPFGGFTYQPNNDWKFDMMAPQPRVARRLTAWCNPRAERWTYLGAGVGGKTWAFESVGGRPDLGQYREFSASLGYEFISKTCPLKWSFETAYLFGRELQFKHGTQSNYKPDNSLALRLQASF